MKHAVLVSAFVCMSACSHLNPAIRDLNAFNKNSVLTSDATLRNAYIVPKSQDPPAAAEVVICAEPQPDAATQLAAKVGVEGAGGGLGTDATAKAAIEYNTAIVQLAGRTSTVLLARDLLFNICMLRANNFIDNNDVATLYDSTITLVGDIAKADRAQGAAAQLRATTDAVQQGVPLDVVASALGYTSDRDLRVSVAASSLFAITDEAKRRELVTPVFNCGVGATACVTQRDGLIAERASPEAIATRIGQLSASRIDALYKALKGTN